LCSRLIPTAREDRLLGLHYHFTETKAQYSCPTLLAETKEGMNACLEKIQTGMQLFIKTMALVVDNLFTLLSTLLQAKTKTRGSSILALSIGTPETQRRMTAFCVNIIAQNNWQAII
jgi:hypothetical protein